MTTEISFFIIIKEYDKEKGTKFGSKLDFVKDIKI
jgi:hypothetical protein